MPSGDVYIINPPKDPSWISVASQWASTWLWEHSDLIPLLLSECLARCRDCRHLLLAGTA